MSGSRPASKLALGLLLLALVALLVAGLRAWVGRNPRAARALDRPIPVHAEPVRREIVVERVGARGIAEPAMVVELPSRVTGVIAAVEVEVGQLVRPGDALVRMEPEIPEAALSAAQAELTRALGEVEVSQLQFERMQSLNREAIVSDVDFEAAKVRLGAARARLSTARKDLEIARQDVELGTIVRSPITAVVQQRHVNAGEAIREVRKPLLKLGRIDALLVAARVAEEKTSAVAIGQSAELMFDAFPHEIFPGVVEKIDGAIDPETRTFRAWIRLDNTDLKLKSGLSAHARIRCERAALTVPRLAVIDRALQAAVFVVAGDRVHLRPVQVVPASLGRVAVLSGLAEGEPVVYYRLMELEDGDRVSVTLSSATPQAAPGIPSPTP